MIDSEREREREKVDCEGDRFLQKEKSDLDMHATHVCSAKQGRLCRAGSRPHYRPQAGLECPIRQPLLLLMGVCTVTLTQTRWRDLGTMPKPQCQGLQGMGEMRLSALIATLLGWVTVPKEAAVCQRAFSGSPGAKMCSPN